MSTNHTAAAPTRGLLATEARLFAREPGWLFWILLFPSLLLGVLGLVPSFREPDPELGGLRVVDLYVPVVVLLAALMASVQSMPTVLAGYRERGVLRRLRATPVSPAALLRAQVLLHGAAVLLGALLAMTLARVAFDTPLPQQPLGWAAAFVLAVAASLSMGAVVTAAASTLKVAQAVGSAVLFPMMFTAGVWLPVQTMPSLLQQIVLWTPLGASARALGDASAGDWPRLLDLAVTAGWTVALGALALRFFRWD